jgi:hypothetical protein
MRFGNAWDWHGHLPFTAPKTTPQITAVEGRGEREIRIATLAMQDRSGLPARRSTPVRAGFPRDARQALPKKMNEGGINMSQQARRPPRLLNAVA